RRRRGVALVTPPTHNPRKILVLQGGGALGSYQAGVYEALKRHGAEPEWVAGVSIGAINAALIAGNPPDRRVARLREFWALASASVPQLPVPGGDQGRALYNETSAAIVATLGVSGFFRPRLPGPWLSLPGTAEALSYYDTAPLRETLLRLVDFDLLNSGAVRLSVGAVNVTTGNLTIFDNTQRRIGPEHIMASGALPPGFPPVIVDGEPFWDGGLVSNTPLRFVLDEETVDDLLIFQVDLFNARGSMPQTLLDAAAREKDIRYSSRTRLNTDANLTLHRAKVALRELLKALPDNCPVDRELLARLARENAVTVVQLIYRQKPYEGHSKDYEFSRQTMLDHWASGV